MARIGKGERMTLRILEQCRRENVADPGVKVTPLPTPDQIIRDVELIDSVFNKDTT